MPCFSSNAIEFVGGGVDGGVGRASLGINGSGHGELTEPSSLALDPGA